MTTNEELERLAKAATPGPWGAWIRSRTIQVDMRGGDGRLPAIINWPGFDGNDMGQAANKDNAAFIAAANPATILALLSERAELLAAVERMRGALERIAKTPLHNDGGAGRRIGQAVTEARAALTTAKATATEQGERG